MSAEVDKEGYLLNLNDWNEKIAAEIAKKEDLVLTAEHWTVLNFLRNFYLKYKLTPAMRVVINELKKDLGANANSAFLQKLFPKGFFIQGCKVAGLPKPSRCV